MKPHDRNRHARTIHVLVADNSPFHTQLLLGALRQETDLKVFSSDLNAASVVAASVGHNIDVVVLSAFVEEDAERGFRTLRELREADHNTRAVILLDSSKLNPFSNRSGQELAVFLTVENLGKRSANAFAKCMEGKSG